MDYLTTDPSPSGGGTIEQRTQPTDVSGRGAALSEARGVVRDVLASVRNLEHLLRSPRVGARAIGQVIPSLKGSCDSLAMSVDQILRQVRSMAAEPVDGAVAELEAFVPSVCERLRESLDQKAGGPLDAKGRLAFENAVVRVGAELNSARQLLDLLVRATERSDTDLFIEEVVSETFVASFRPGTRRNPVRVVASYSSDSTGFRATPQIIMPLISVAIALTRGGPDEPIYLHAICLQDEPVQILIGREGPKGTEEFEFDAPLVIPPTLACAETATRLAGGKFVAEPTRVTMSWSR